MITLRQPKTICLTLTLIVLLGVNQSAAAPNEPNHEINSQLSLQTMVCYVDNIDFSIDVPMPSEWSLDKIEETSMRICNSVQKLAPPKAVCDTDMNCVRWDRYHQYGIKTIFVAEDRFQDGEELLLQVTCESGVVWYITDPTKMKTCCKIKIIPHQELSKP